MMLDNFYPNDNTTTHSTTMTTLLYILHNLDKYSLVLNI